MHFKAKNEVRSSEKNNDHSETYDQEQMNAFRIQSKRQRIISAVFCCYASVSFCFFRNTLMLSTSRLVANKAYMAFVWLAPVSMGSLTF